MPPAGWLVAQVSMYARPRRRKRPSVAKPPKFIREVGRHGSRHMVLVKVAGKRVLRYVTDAELAACSAPSVE
jgi:hypothetical protein